MDKIQDKEIEFVSIKEYVLSYGHNGEHIKLIRTRCNKNFYNQNIAFYLIEIDLLNNKIKTKSINENKIKNLFEKYYPESSHLKLVEKFINGVL